MVNGDMEVYLNMISLLGHCCLYHQQKGHLQKEMAVTDRTDESKLSDVLPGEVAAFTAGKQQVAGTEAGVYALNKVGGGERSLYLLIAGSVERSSGKELITSVTKMHRCGAGCGAFYAAPVPGAPACRC